jgi:cytochrome P450
MGEDAPLPAGAVRLDALPMGESRTDAYQIVRAAGPIARSVRGAYLLTSAGLAEYALKHPELFSSKQAFDGVGSPLPMVPIEFDPPEHSRYRRLLQPFFSPRGTAAWQPQVRDLVGELIDAFIGRGDCDLVAELAVPLPAEVFLTLFGLPLADRDRLIGWKNGLLHAGLSAEPSDEVVRAGTALFEYLVGHIAQRRRRGGTEDLLGRLLADTSDDRLSEEELLGMSFLFVSCWPAWTR